MLMQSSCKECKLEDQLHSLGHISSQHLQSFR